MSISFIKARAEDELARRQASNVQHSEDFYHPWSLPKGNFKHRMLSTGMYLSYVLMYLHSQMVVVSQSGLKCTNDSPDRVSIYTSNQHVGRRLVNMSTDT